MQNRTGLLATMFLVSSCWVGCESLSHFQELYTPAPVVPTVLEGDSVDVVTVLVRGKARSYVTSRDELSLQLHFDPAVAEASRVRSFILWRRDRDFGSWDRFGTFPFHTRTVKMSGLREGAHGVLTSLVYENGVEGLLPGGDEEPLVWILVDRSAPVLWWVDPTAGREIRGDRSMTLRWQASDMEFGREQTFVEWSPDNGQSWHLVGVVAAKSGAQSLSWRVPTFAVDRVLLRVSARDLIGHESTATIEVRLAGGLRSGIARTPSPARPSPEATLLPRPTVVVSPAPGGLARPAFSRGRGVPAAPVVAGLRHEDSKGAGLAPDGTGGDTGLELLNFQDGAVHPGGVARYIFFGAGGLNPDARVGVEWAESPEEPWQKVGASVSARDGKYLWKLPRRTVTAGRLRLVAVSRRGGTLVAMSRLPILIDGEPPVAEIRGIRRDVTGCHVVHLNCYDRGPAGLDRARLFMTLDGGQTWSELPVEDASSAVRLPEVSGSVGLWVAARDRVGQETPLPSAGAEPQKVYTPGRPVVLTVNNPEYEVMQGGAEYTLRWHFEGEEPATAALLEISSSGGLDWELLDEATLGSGRALVILPARDGQSYVFRIRARLSDGTFVESRSRRFALDSSPPQIEIGPVPRRTGATLVLPLRLNDPGGAGLDAVFAHVRREGSEVWTLLPADLFSHGDGRATISLGGLEEGAWELRVNATDGVGNGLQTPGPDTPPHGRFILDRTPPRIEARPTAFPWVEGQIATAEVDLDRGDIVPPLVLESRAPDGGWKEMHRWASLPPVRELLRFRVPVGRDELVLRFSARDRVGNLSYALMRPHPVERSIALRARDTRNLVAGSNHSIEWELHPTLRELTRELAVEVSSRLDDQKLWHQIYDGLPVDGACVWTVPPASGSSCSLRLRLFHEGAVVGTSTSASQFRISPAPAPSEVRVDAVVATADTGGSSRGPVPTVSRINPSFGAAVVTSAASAESRSLSDRSWAQLRLHDQNRQRFDRWYDDLAGGLRRDPSTGDVLASEWEDVPAESRRQLARYTNDLSSALSQVNENFTASIRLDSRNADATYGLALLLLRHYPERLREATHWLTETVAIRPEHIDAANDLGAALIRQRDYERAEQALKSALRLDDQPEIRYNLALALFYQKRPAEARPHFTVALERGGPTLARGDLYYYLVMCLVQEGEIDAARDRYTKWEPYIAVELKPSIERAFNP